MKKGDFRLISLGVGMKLPDGYKANIYPRSSTYKNFGIILANSVGQIDNSYSGDNDCWKFPAIAMRDTVIHKNDRICQFEIQVILKHNIYSVDAVYNGQEAYDYIMAGVYDGVILDVMMPKMDGFTVLSKIRSEGCDVPVIMLTAKSETDDKINGLDLGADDYLAKPFDTKELLARIRAITRRKSEAVSTDVIYGDCTLNSLNYELSSGGGSVKLQNKEYQIMELLMANQKSIISAELMMEKIWGYDTDTEISVVWVNISYLRKKLGQIGSKVSIKAVRNQGYTLEYSE